MAAHADGVIVGSAIVKLCAKYGRDCVPYIKDYVASMKDAIRSKDTHVKPCNYIKELPYLDSLWFL